MNAKKENAVVFWVFLAPVIFAFVMVIVIPFFTGAFYSFTDWSSSARVSSGLKFVGFSNFTNSLSDPSFIYSFFLTLVFTLLNMVAINVVAFLLAMAVTRALKLRNVYRIGFFLPNLIGGLILGYVWQFIFNNAIPAFGEMSGFLSSLAEADNLILGNRNSAVFAMVTVSTWKTAGYIMMIYIAALESIPAELHEAATIDGAAAFRKLRSITLPMMAQAFTITMFLTLVQSFKEFDVNVSLTAGGPSTLFMDKPIFGTELLALDIYNTAFVANSLAMGQARAVIFFVVLVIVALVQVYFNKRREVEM